METTTTFTCDKCCQHKTYTGLGTGYGRDNEDRKICYECCAINDRAKMQETGKATLYLADSKVSNWPGTLAFNIHHKKTGRHNIAGKRYDVWFTGPDSQPWHGVTYGDNTQICHCKRIRA